MTFEFIRGKYPVLSDDEWRLVVELLNRAPASVWRIWEGEAQMTGVAQGVGPDGLTRAMRELNSFSESHGLPLPFP